MAGRGRDQVRQPRRHRGALPAVLPPPRLPPRFRRRGRSGAVLRLTILRSAIQLLQRSQLARARCPCAKSNFVGKKPARHLPIEHNRIGRPYIPVGESSRASRLPRVSTIAVRLSLLPHRRSALLRLLLGRGLGGSALLRLLLGRGLGRSALLHLLLGRGTLPIRGTRLRYLPHCTLVLMLRGLL